MRGRGEAKVCRWWEGTRTLGRERGRERSEKTRLKRIQLCFEVGVGRTTKESNQLRMSN